MCTRGERIALLLPVNRAGDTCLFYIIDIEYQVIIGITWNLPVEGQHPRPGNRGLQPRGVAMGDIAALGGVTIVVGGSGLRKPLSGIPTCGPGQVCIIHCFPKRIPAWVISIDRGYRGLANCWIIIIGVIYGIQRIRVPSDNYEMAINLANAGIPMIDFPFSLNRQICAICSPIIRICCILSCPFDTSATSIVGYLP